jgi:hypothetical protein
VAGAAVLLGSLLLTWSHQITPALRARVAPVALFGVPGDASALQVYAIAGEVLAGLALGMAAAGLWGRRRVCLGLVGGVIVAIAFTVHALVNPPTNGLLLAAGPEHYLNVHARPGAGEPVAVAGLIASGLGLLARAVTGPRVSPQPADPTEQNRPHARLS